MKLDLNLLPFLCEAFSTNNKIYKYIDDLYKKNKFEYYKLAKSHELYDHPIASEGSLLQEEYFKKSLGIFIKLQQESELINSIVPIIKYGWSYVYNYINTHTTINLEEFTKNFVHKNKGLNNITDDDMNSNVIMLFFLSQYFEKEIEESELFTNFIKSLLYRMEHYKGKDRVNYAKISKEDLKLIRSIILSLKKIGLSKHLNNTLKDEDLHRYLNCLDLIFDYESISLVSIVNDVKFTNKDLEEIIYLYLLYKNNIKNIEDVDINEISKFVIDLLHIRYFSKAYKIVKQHYFQNNKETMYVDIEEKELELEEVKKERLLLQDTKENLLNTTLEQEKEIIRLKEELNKATENKEELNKLREFIFNFDNLDISSTADPTDYNKLKNLNAIIIGGHPNWQHKMKNYLSNCKFISPEALNFDTSIFNNVEIVFIYTNYLNHAMYYRVMTEIKDKDIQLQYLKANTNIDIVLNQILHLLN